MEDSDVRGVRAGSIKKAWKLGCDEGEGETRLAGGREIRRVLLRDRMQQSGDEIDIGS